jgi:hypothetical protein
LDRHIFNESEMALFFECMPLCAQKVLDTADIVREAMLRQLLALTARIPLNAVQIVCGRRF